MLILLWDFLWGTFFWNIINFINIVILDMFAICEISINVYIASKNLNMWNYYANCDPIFIITYITNNEIQYSRIESHNAMLE